MCGRLRRGCRHVRQCPPASQRRGALQGDRKSKQRSCVQLRCRVAGLCCGEALCCIVSLLLEKAVGSDERTMSDGGKRSWNIAHISVSSPAQSSLTQGGSCHCTQWDQRPPSLLSHDTGSLEPFIKGLVESEHLSVLFWAWCFHSVCLSSHDPSGWWRATAWRRESVSVAWVGQAGSHRGADLAQDSQGHLCFDSISALTPLGSKRSPDIATESPAAEEITVCPGKSHHDST